MEHYYLECPTPNITPGFVYNFTLVEVYVRARHGTTSIQHTTFILPFLMNLFLSTVELKLCLQKGDNKTEKTTEKEKKIKVKIIGTIAN